jgi:hypothetical protein
VKTPNINGERCFVRRIQLPNKTGQTGVNQIGKIEIKIKNFNSSDFNNSNANTNVYLASTSSSRVMHLNGVRNTSTNSATIADVADPGTFANSAWVFEGTGVFTINSITNYYLIVTMKKDSTNIGTITLTRKD